MWAEVAAARGEAAAMEDQLREALRRGFSFGAPTEGETRLAEMIVERVPGVASFDLWGGSEREIQVNFLTEKITALGL